MADLVQIKPDDISTNIVEHFPAIIPFKNVLFSWMTLVIVVSFSLVFAFILGQRTIMKNVIIDTTLKENLENVEQTKKKLKKRMAYWSDTLETFKWFGIFIGFLAAVYLVLYLLNPMYIELFQPIVKNVYFVQGFALLIICLFAFVRFALHKQNSIRNEFNDIDQEAQSLFEDILNKMGSKLTKSMADALIKKRAIKESKGYCKKEICRRQKYILDKKTKGSQGLLAEIGKFDWCPICSSELEFTPTPNTQREEVREKIPEEGKNFETDEAKCRTCVEREIQTEEFLCKKNCGKRFFKYCKSKGASYKDQLDEIAILENQVRQMEAEYSRDQNLLK